MWIQWVGNIAERRGLGIVHKEFWDALEPEPREIILGWVTHRLWKGNHDMHLSKLSTPSSILTLWCDGPMKETTKIMPETAHTEPSDKTSTTMVPCSWSKSVYAKAWARRPWLVSMKRWIGRKMRVYIDDGIDHEVDLGGRQQDTCDITWLKLPLGGCCAIGCPVLLAVSRCTKADMWGHVIVAAYEGFALRFFKYRLVGSGIIDLFHWS